MTVATHGDKIEKRFIESVGIGLMMSLRGAHGAAVKLSLADIVIAVEYSLALAPPLIRLQIFLIISAPLFDGSQALGLECAADLTPVIIACRLVKFRRIGWRVSVLDRRAYGLETNETLPPISDCAVALMTTANF